jgi:hypothetical protein
VNGCRRGGVTLGGWGGSEGVWLRFGVERGPQVP